MHGVKTCRHLPGSVVARRGSTFASSSTWCAMKACAEQKGGKHALVLCLTGHAAHKATDRHACTVQLKYRPAAAHLLQLLHALDQLAALHQQLGHRHRLQGDSRSGGKRPEAIVGCVLAQCCDALLPSIRCNTAACCPCFASSLRHCGSHPAAGAHLPCQQPVVVLQQDAQH